MKGDNRRDDRNILVFPAQQYLSCNKSVFYCYVTLLTLFNRGGRWYDKDGISSIWGLLFLFWIIISKLHGQSLRPLSCRIINFTPSIVSLTHQGKSSVRLQKSSSQPIVKILKIFMDNRLPLAPSGWTCLCYVLSL